MSKLYSLHDDGTQARDNEVAIDYLAPPPIPTESGVREDDYEDDICVRRWRYCGTWRIES
jgi:hypothetical protein